VEVRKRKRRWRRMWNKGVRGGGGRQSEKGEKEVEEDVE
jgi:hypothetical protein